MSRKLESVSDIIDYLKKRVKYARSRVEHGYHMNDNLTKWGGYRVGYAQARLSVYENLLDDICGDNSWESELNSKESNDDP